MFWVCHGSGTGAEVALTEPCPTLMSNALQPDCRTAAQTLGPETLADNR